MKVAIISDIHANIPALIQTLKNIKEQNIDVVYYDIEKTAQAIEESPLPNVYVLMLRKAY